MNPEDILKQAIDTLSSDPELARRNVEMRALLERAQTVADMVNAYKVGCIPPNAGPRQIAETEQAMFAACHMLMQMFMTKVDEGEEAAQQWVAAVMKECSSYAAQRLMTLQTPGSTAH